MLLCTGSLEPSVDSLSANTVCGCVNLVLLARWRQSCHKMSQNGLPKDEQQLQQARWFSANRFIPLTIIGMAIKHVHINVCIASASPIIALQQLSLSCLPESALLAAGDH
jgi:hypothetical protein